MKRMCWSGSKGQWPEEKGKEFITTLILKKLVSYGFIGQM